MNRLWSQTLPAERCGKAYSEVADTIRLSADFPMKMDDEVGFEPGLTVDSDFHRIRFGICAPPDDLDEAKWRIPG